MIALLAPVDSCTPTLRYINKFYDMAETIDFATIQNTDLL